jgi:hypothetical protein
MGKCMTRSLLVRSVLLLSIASTSITAQAQQPSGLVIEGGTLIDGNGGAPIQDSVVIIQGNKITAVSKKGQLSYPENTQLIQADGKFILPGLWEAESVYAWYMGEAYLLNGVTSTIDIGTGGEVSALHTKAVQHGKTGGPRTFIGAGYLASRAGGRGTGFETPLTPNRVPQSVDDAREIARGFIAAGAYGVIFQDGGLSAEHFRAVFDEVHKAGRVAVARPTGPIVYPKDAVLAGATFLSHAAGVDIVIAKDFEKWKGNQHNLDLEAYSDMDDTKAAGLIQFLVQHNVALSPTLIRKGRGFQKGQAHFEAQDRAMFSNPNLRAYYPEEAIESVLMNYLPQDLKDDVRERRRIGYQNALRFYRQFVQAGGRVLPGGNAPNNCAPGLCLHQELEIYEEAGLTPMQMIQSATKWPAETVRASDSLGTIEVGKLADLVIVNEDPLMDIRNLRKIDQVIFDGKKVDRKFHSWYQTPFLGSTGGGGNPVVESLPWIATLRQAVFRPRQGGRDPLQLPPPGIETISPYIVTQGSPTITLTIKGFNFFARSQVFFDNVPIPFKRVSITELQATIDENLLRRVGRFAITVKNPEPLEIPEAGDGTSNRANILVDFRY